MLLLVFLCYRVKRCSPSQSICSPDGLQEGRGLSLSLGPNWPGRTKAWSAGTHPAPLSRPQLVLYSDGPQKHPCAWSNLSSELGIWSHPWWGCTELCRSFQTCFRPLAEGNTLSQPILASGSRRPCSTVRAGFLKPGAASETTLSPSSKLLRGGVGC